MSGSFNNLADFLWEAKSYNPFVPGIYILKNDNKKEIYIGESYDIHGRIHHHRLTNKKVRKWDGDWDNVEIIVYEMPDCPSNNINDSSRRREIEKKVIDIIENEWSDYTITNKK